MTDWTTATCTDRGRHHRETGAPNEDHVRVEAGDGVVVAAVADGHGAPRYTRADRGSRLATAAALHVLQPPPDDLQDLPARLVARWRELVADDVAEDPPGGAVDPHERYGTTLLAVHATAERLLLVQLGDGDILLGTTDGPRHPIEAVQYAFSSATDSLVQEDAEDRVRIQVVDPAGVEFLLLATDGLEATHAGRDWYAEVVGRLREDLDGTGPDAVQDVLAGWCRRCAETGGDDSTLALLVAPALLGR